MGCASPGTSGGLLHTVAASRRVVRGSFCAACWAAYTTVKNAVPNVDALKRAALRDKALGALRDLASGAEFTDQVSARHVSIAIGIRPDLVKSLISAELECTR